MVIFAFWLFKMCWNTYFTVFLNISQYLSKKRPPKTITFHILQNTGYNRKTFSFNPLLTKNWRFSFSLSSLKRKDIDVEQKTQKKKDLEKGFERQSKTENRQKQKGLMKITLYFNVLMLFFWWNRSKETRQRNKQTKRRKQKQNRKKRKEKTNKRTRERERERQRKRESKREVKLKAREKQRETLKNKQKCTFLGGKQTFLQKEKKERKNRKQNRTNQKK